MEKVKGFRIMGSTILGYKIVPVADFGEKYAYGLTSIKTTGKENANNYNCDKKLRKITYRKYMKTANRL